jgi:hypothetical protein
MCGGPVHAGHHDVEQDHAGVQGMVQRWRLAIDGAHDLRWDENANWE